MLFRVVQSANDFFDPTGFTVGTIEQYKTEAHALKAAEGMRLMINDGITRRDPVLFCGLMDRFLLDQKQEQEAEQITHNTLASYWSMISQHIRPEWGDAYLEDVRPALVQDWLRRLVVSPKYKGHIRSLMYRLFDKAMLWELLNVERNPMDLVEVKGISKRKQRPRVLQVKDAWQILDALVQPFRTIVLSGLCFGLRISEILGLRWTDFDFERSVVLIQRSAVGKRLNKLKTEYSQDEVPIEPGFILELKKWQALCVETEGRWLFPSPVTGRPYHADSIRADYLVPTGLQLGLGRIGFHMFRHTYRALAGRNRSTRGRSAETHATRAHLHHDGSVWKYLGLGKTQSKSANRATPVEKVGHSAGLHSINKGNCVAVPLIGQFWTVAASAQSPVTL
jgi:integrase